jgi:hypothetical protein
MLKFKNTQIDKLIKISLSLWIFLLIAYRITICFSYLPELSNGESNNIWKAINVANGKSIYTNPEELPLEVFQYTPISQIPIIGIAKILDKNGPNYVYLVTALGRLYELIANIFLVILIYYISKKWFDTTIITNLLISLVSFTLLTNPAFTIRPDATLLLFLIITIWSYLNMEESTKFSWIILTASLITICFFTKQDGILIAGPLAIRLLILKKWKQLVLLSTIAIGILFTSIIISPLVFGPNFYTCVFKGLKNTSSLQQIIVVFDRAYGFYAFHFVFGIISSMYFIIKHPKEKIALFSILSIFYLFVAISTSSKSGSWVNYYTPYIVFSTILIFTFFSKLIYSSLKINPLFSFYIAVSFSVFFLFKQVYVYTSPFLIHSNGKDHYYKEFNEIIKLKSKLKISKNDFILTANQLDRNFLANNSIMINTEYYSYASYKYESFKKQKNKKIDYIIFKIKDKPSIDYLLQFFNVSTENYSEFKINNFHILKKV